MLDSAARDYFHQHRNVHWTLLCEGIQLTDFACSRSNTYRSELSLESSSTGEFVKIVKGLFEKDRPYSSPNNPSVVRAHMYYSLHLLYAGHFVCLYAISHFIFLSGYKIGTISAALSSK